MIEHISPKKRINPQREFFNIPPDDALSILYDVAELIDDAEIITYNENHKVEKQENNERLTIFSFSHITKEQILFSANFVDKHGIPARYDSISRYVIINGKRYAPKYIMALAYYYASGFPENELAHKIKELRILNHFHTNDTFKIYKKLEFEIEEKNNNE